MIIGDNNLVKKTLPCPICESLGEALFVDFDEGERFPEGFYKLEMVQWFSESHDLRRCPQCGAYYYFTFETDNDIFCPTHTGEYKRIPSEEAERMLQEYKACLEKRGEEYRKQVRKLHGKVIRTLPEVEKRIVGYLTDRLWDETYAEDISEDLGIDVAVVEKALESLKEKGVVEESTYSKELVEKRGFSKSNMRYHIRRI